MLRGRMCMHVIKFEPYVYVVIMLFTALK